MLVRRLMKRWDEKIIKLVEDGRFLIISPFNEKIKRPTISTALKRNEVIAELSDKLFLAYYADKGNLARIATK